MYQSDGSSSLSSPLPYLTRMVLFLIITMLIIGALSLPSTQLRFFFMTNPALNGLILLMLLLGAIFAFRSVFVLWHEIRWVNMVQISGKMLPSSEPKLLAPLLALLHRSQGKLVLTQTSLALITDSVAARMDEAREILRYFIGLLVFLGLLGTFWGLLVTVSAVGDLIARLAQIDGEQSAVLFNQLIAGLSKPLGGMGTAFSSSLFGLAGSLILGFLDLQLGQAQNRFIMELEDWLSTQARFAPEGGAINTRDDLSDVTQSLDNILTRLRGGR